MQALYTCIWFDHQATEASDFYCTVFPDSKLLERNPMVSKWSSAGSTFMCLNEGPMFQPNPSFSTYVTFEKEEDIQAVWDKLIQGGKALMELGSYPWSPKYGWVNDQFGVSWQLNLHEEVTKSQKFSPAIMLTGEKFGRGQEAIDYYTSIFPNSSPKLVSKYGPENGDQEGKINHAQILLNGQMLVLMESNLNHGFKLNEGMSLVIPCDSQEEIDYYWEKLTDGGEESMCGWLKDKFGLSWQVIPAELGKLMQDPGKGQKVIDAFLKMRKFDLETLRKL